MCVSAFGLEVRDPARPYRASLLRLIQQVGRTAKKSYDLGISATLLGSTTAAAKEAEAAAAALGLKL